MLTNYSKIGAEYPHCTLKNKTRYRYLTFRSKRPTHSAILGDDICSGLWCMWAWNRYLTTGNACKASKPNNATVLFTHKLLHGYQQLCRYLKRNEFLTLTGRHSSTQSTHLWHDNFLLNTDNRQLVARLDDVWSDLCKFMLWPISFNNHCRATCDITIECVIKMVYGTRHNFSNSKVIFK